MQSNPFIKSSNLIKSSSSIAQVTQYYNIYMLSSNSSSDIPKAYIVSKPSDISSDSANDLNNKIVKLRNRINSYSEWTSGSEKISSELACYNLQKYSYSDSNKLNTIFYKINKYRSNNSIDLLRMDNRLQLYAMERAIEIAWIYDTTGNYSSLTPTGDTPNKLAECNYEAYSENLAYNGNTVNDVFNIWTNLDFSRKSMLDPDYNYAGVGIAEAKDGTLFWVIMYIKK